MLVTPQELNSIIDDEHTVILDVRFTLGQPSQGLTDYLQSHIPGAYYFDLERDLSSEIAEHGGRHPLPNEHDVAVKLGAAGIDSHARVVVYDGGEGMAARAWWLIRYLGHDNVYLLDGGYRAWTAAGYRTTDAVAEPRIRVFPLNVHHDWTVSTDTVEQIVSGVVSGVLVDARAAARYRGDVEPLDARAGHIPGALNLPYQDGFMDEGTWRDAGAQRERFENVISTGEPLIAYCGSGVTACNLIFAAELAGIQGVRLYPGSWSDWCSYPNHDIESGAERTNL